MELCSIYYFELYYQVETILLYLHFILCSFVVFMTWNSFHGDVGLVSGL